MKRILPFLLFWAMLVSACAQNIPSIDTQIQQALMALPENFQEEATVLGYKNPSELTVIRQGTNTMICLADDPNKDGFSVAGYHMDLDPYMQRGRDLKKQGKNFQEIFDIREKEVQSEKLTIPMNSTLYVVTGDFDTAGQPFDIYKRFVIYIPFATEATSGLSTAPSYPGGPWIMNPGTHRAHIMINPTPVDEKP